MEDFTNSTTSATLKERVDTVFRYFYTMKKNRRTYNKLSIQEFTEKTSEMTKLLDLARMDENKEIEQSLKTPQGEIYLYEVCDKIRDILKIAKPLFDEPPTAVDTRRKDLDDLDYNQLLKHDKADEAIDRFWNTRGALFYRIQSHIPLHAIVYGGLNGNPSIMLSGKYMEQERILNLLPMFCQKYPSVDCFDRDSSKYNQFTELWGKLMKIDDLQELLSSSPDTICPVCREINFTPDASFAILSGCRHLLCTHCADSIFNVHAEDFRNKR